jgi:hypothetical protein
MLGKFARAGGGTRIYSKDASELTSFNQLLSTESAEEAGKLGGEQYYDELSALPRVQNLGLLRIKEVFDEESEQISERP